MKVQKQQYIQFYSACRLEDSKTVYYNPENTLFAYSSREANKTNTPPAWLEIDGIGTKAETLVLFPESIPGKKGVSKLSWIEHPDLELEHPILQSLFSAFDNVVKIFNLGQSNKHQQKPTVKALRDEYTLPVTLQEVLSELSSSSFKTIDFTNELVSQIIARDKNLTPLSESEIEQIKNLLPYIKREDFIEYLKKEYFKAAHRIKEEDFTGIDTRWAHLSLDEILVTGSLRNFYDAGIINIEDLTNNEDLITLSNKLGKEDFAFWYNEMHNMIYGIHNTLDLSSTGIGINQRSFTTPISMLAANDKQTDPDELRKMLNILGEVADDLSHSTLSVVDTVRQAFLRSYLPIWLEKNYARKSSRTASKEGFAEQVKALPGNLAFFKTFIGNKRLKDLIALSIKLHEDGLAGRRIIGNIIQQGLDRNPPVQEPKTSKSKDSWSSLTDSEWTDPETGFILKPLVSKSDLERPAEELRHCVKDDPKYAIDCRKAKHVLYSIIDTNGELISTIQIQTSLTPSNDAKELQINLNENSAIYLYVLQHTGKHNSNASSTAKKAGNNFLQALKDGQITVNQEYLQTMEGSNTKHTKTKDSLYQEIIEFIGYDPIQNPEITRELWRYFSGDNMAYERNADGSFKLDENNRRIPIMEIQYQTQNGQWVLDENQNKIPIMVKGADGQPVPLMKIKREYPDLYPNKNIEERAVLNKATGKWSSPKVNKYRPFLGNNKAQTPEQFWGLES